MYHGAFGYMDVADGEAAVLVGWGTGTVLDVKRKQEP
jgi:hypothetical protein